VHARPHPRPQVRRAARHNAIVWRPRKRQALNPAHNIQRRLQPVKHVVQQRPLLHAHDPQVVLLPNPDHKPAVLRHIAPAPVRPVRRNPRARKVRVRRHVLEHNVVRNKLLVLLLRDLVRVPGRQRVVPAPVLWHRLQLLKRLAHLALKLDAVLLGHGPRQWKVSKVAPNTHPHAQRRKPKRLKIKLPALRQALHAVKVPVVHVLRVHRHPVVVRNHLAEKRLEPVIVGRLHGIAPH